MDASFGSHPIFEFLKCCRRIGTRPYVLGSMVRFGGYLWWLCAGRKALIPEAAMSFLRKEQMAKLRRAAWLFRNETVREPTRS
jgi:hypothetical protein